MGQERGRLAVALDLLTDSLALVGQHGVYCRSERFPGRPKMDIAMVLEQLTDAKQLDATATADEWREAAVHARILMRLDKTVPGEDGTDALEESFSRRLA